MIAEDGSSGPAASTRRSSSGRSRHGGRRSRFDSREPVPQRWIGRVDGAVVATSRVCLGAGVAGLYAISTLGAHRGRGYGRALTIAALRAAASLGYRIGVLQASDLGYGVYRRLGFRELFRYDVFVAPPPAP